SAGLVCRGTGRSRVLSAAPALLADGGPLRGALLDRVLSERSRDVLPLFEVLLAAGDPETAPRVVRAIRQIAIPFACAAALRVIPDGKISLSLLRGLCEDAFAGADSHRFDAEAVSAVGSVAMGHANAPDVQARIYAAAALAHFDRKLVQPVARHLARRRLWMPV